MSQSLWINSSKHSQRKSLLEQWLKDINYNAVSAIESVAASQVNPKLIYAVNGQVLNEVPANGMYIENGVKKVRK